MDSTTALGVLAALSQTTRMEAFRLLVAHEPSGLPAGEVAGALGVPQNTLSAHLAVLTRAGLVQALRQGRSMIYRVRLDRLRELTVFLVNDCCGARPELCQPLLAELDPCCPITLPER